MMTTPKIKFHEVFSPAIMETEVPQKFVDIVNKVGDKVLSDEKQSVQWDWSHKLVGKVHKEVRIPITTKEDGAYCMKIMKDACVKYLQHLRKTKRDYEWTRIAGIEKPPTTENIHLSQSWIVSQYKNEMEEHFENEKRDHYPASGLIDFKFGEKQDMRTDTFLFHPKLRKMLLFPSWLNHTVYPFYCEGERRSMSFNASFFVPEGWHKK